MGVGHTASKHTSLIVDDSSIEEITNKSEKLTIGPAVVDAFNETDFLMPQRNHGLYGVSISKWMNVSDLIEAGKDVEMSSECGGNRIIVRTSRPKGTGRLKRLKKKNRREMKFRQTNRRNHLPTKKLMDRQKYRKNEASLIRRIAALKCS